MCHDLPTDHSFDLFVQRRAEIQNLFERQEQLLLEIVRGHSDVRTRTG